MKGRLLRYKVDPLGRPQRRCRKSDGDCGGGTRFGGLLVVLVLRVTIVVVLIRAKNPFLVIVEERSTVRKAPLQSFFAFGVVLLFGVTLPMMAFVLNPACFCLRCIPNGSGDQFPFK